MMRRRMKIALVTLAAGIVVLLAGFAAADFELNNLSTGGELMARTYVSQGERVRTIYVSDLDANVEITPSTDGRARVTCEENEAFCYDITEEDSVLRIEKRDLRGWNLGMYFGFWPESTLTVEVPASALLNVETESGDIHMMGSDEGPAYYIVKLYSDNGDVHLEHVRAGEGGDETASSRAESDAMGDVQPGEITVETNTGDIAIEDADISFLSAMTDNGAVTLRDIRAEGVFATARNDTIRMEGIATGSLIASSANGDVLFSEVEVAEHIILLAGNGNIRGELPGEMRDYHIESETDNGDNNLPAMLDGEGIFLRAINDNGDIDVTFAG